MHCTKNRSEYFCDIYFYPLLYISIFFSDAHRVFVTYFFPVGFSKILSLPTFSKRCVVCSYNNFEYFLSYPRFILLTPFFQFCSMIHGHWKGTINFLQELIFFINIAAKNLYSNLLDILVLYYWQYFSALPCIFVENVCASWSSF